MKTQVSEQGWNFHSPCLALALQKNSPQIAYFGIESGGRSRRHLDKNLLRSGFGGEILPGKQLDFSRELETGPLLFVGDTAKCQMSFIDERTFTIKFEAKEDLLTGTLFSFSFAPDISPPSLWAEPLDWKRMLNPLEADPFAPQSFTREFHMPGLISFPEFGLLKCEARIPNLVIHETLIPDPTNAGMNLGFNNSGNHNNRRAFHHGRFEIAFRIRELVQEVELIFTVIPEIYPDIPGCDFNDPKWNGLKRNWMNNFTLNPPTLSLGDNPILHGLGHLSIHWKSDIAVFTPELHPGISLHRYFRQALELTFTQHTDDAGKMTGYGWENGACNLIALEDYLTGTGDWIFAKEHLSTIRKIINYNLSLDRDDDGILEAAYHGNHFRDEKTSLNWWDAFAFGHKDAYGNLVYHQAFRRIIPVLERLNQSDLVAKLEQFLAKFRSNFHDIFYNEGTGVYAGWISRDGQFHDYMFTFITAMAINEGLVDDGLARRMLECLWTKLKENGYGEYKYGVPGPVIPVHPDDRSDWGPMGNWGQYENGGFCGQTAYHFILALYRVGMRDEADLVLFNMLNTFENMPTQSGLTTRFTESWDWRTKDGLPCGYNYLADNYIFLLAAIQGYFGIGLPKI